MPAAGLPCTKHMPQEASPARGLHVGPRLKGPIIAIDIDLILRLARELQRLELTRTRAHELAEETADLVESVFAAAAGVDFEDEPGQFLAALSELRER